MPDHKDLTFAQAQLLFKILELQKTSLRKQITNEELAKQLNTKEGNVRGLINNIKALSKPYEYLEVHELKEKPGRGRPKHYYGLNPKKIITFTETALILLELLDFPQVKPLCVSRNEFEDHMVNTCDLKANLVRERINFGIAANYIETEGYDLIYPSERVSCEIIYIELVAGPRKNRLN